MRSPMEWRKVCEGIPYDVSDNSAHVIMNDMAENGHDDTVAAWKEFLTSPSIQVARVAVSECIEAINEAAAQYDKSVLLAKKTLRAMQESLKSNFPTDTT